MTDFQTEADHYFSKENQLFSRREYDKAIISARLSRNGFSDDIMYQNIGLTYILKGEYAKAARNYTISLAVNPKLNLAWNGCGFCLFNLGKYDGAISKFKKAVEVDSKYTQAYLNWGLSLHCMKEEAEASEIIGKALSSTNLNYKAIVERYELQLSFAEERLLKAANEEAKALLKEQINGYQWVLKFIAKKIDEQIFERVSP